MHLHPLEKQVQHISAFASLKEGIKFVRHEPIIRSLMILVAVTSLFGMSLGTLLPAWSVKIFHGDATTNGILFSARGIGSLLGSLTIAILGRTHIRGKLITAGSLLFPIFIVLFALTSNLPIALILMALLGVAAIFVINLSNATIQSLVPDALRGRVMGVYSTTFMGSIPLGALFLGIIADHAGEAEAAIISSAVALCASIAVWYFVPKVRRIV
jgi:predicted MFS family arabinose efflux permease